MMTGWTHANPTDPKQYNERVRTILAQQTWCNLLCWDLEDGEIADVLGFMERMSISRL